MRNLPAFTAIALVTACTAPQAERQIVGEVSFAANTYPIRAANADGTVWQVMVDGKPVTCLKPTKDDCYWSLRNHLTGQELLDDLPG